MSPSVLRRKTKVWPAALVVIVILIVVFSAYFFVLAPRMSIVNWTHTSSPIPQTVEEWQFTFTVMVKNSGILAGTTTIVCEFAYVNSTQGTRSFTGSLAVEIKGGEQAEYNVKVLLPVFDAMNAILTQNKTWNVRLA